MNVSFIHPNVQCPYCGRLKLDAKRVSNFNGTCIDLELVCKCGHIVATVKKWPVKSISFEDTAPNSQEALLLTIMPVEERNHKREKRNALQEFLKPEIGANILNDPTQLDSWTKRTGLTKEQLIKRKIRMM